VAMAALVLLAGCSDQPSSPKTGALGNTAIDLPVEALAGSHMFCEKLVDPLPDLMAKTPGPEATAFANFQTVYNTDYVSAGVGGLRDVGSGMITLAGVTGPVSAAYLYWNGPTNSNDPTINANVTVNSDAVVGTNIGFSHDNCWMFSNTQSYRADVTSLVQSTGNGVYNLTGFKFDANDVADGANTNGASLVVFFDDGNPANNRDVVVFNGNDSNVASGYDPVGWDVMLSGVVYFAGTAGIQLHVADGQEYVDDDVLLNGATLAAGPAVFQGNTVPAANNGPLNNGSLWDIRGWDITSFLSVGSNDLRVTTGLVADCLGLVVALVDLPAGSAPGEPAFFTGGGHLLIDEARMTFGFNAGPRYPGDDPRGQLQFNDHATGMKVHSTSVDLFNAGLDCAAFSGECKVDNVSGYTYLAFVCDQDEPGAGVDYFALTVWDEGGMVVLQVGDYIAGGNIQRHALMDAVSEVGPTPVNGTE
jgi:hypothetical protein